MAQTSAEKLLEQLEAFNQTDYSALSPELRTRLSEAAKTTSLRLETPVEVLTRVLVTQPIEAIAIRLGTDLRVFSTIGKNQCTADELATATGAAPKLMMRVLRALAAYRAVKEVGVNIYASSPNHEYFQRKELEAAFGNCQDILNKSLTSLPGFLASTSYREPVDPLDTAIQFSYGIKGKGYMETLMTDPSNISALGSFSVLMSVWADGFTQMPDIYPVKDRLETGFDTESVMWVDVGGGHGQKTVALKKSFPGLPGRFIVQDTPQVLASAAKDDEAYKGIELTPHDFFTPQPVKGARCYYIRQCLHNWPDSSCTKILEQLKEAAKPGYSRILIHEIIVPELGASPWVASQDFNMMSMFAVAERTEQQWRALAKSAGLEVSNVYINDHSSREGILELMA